MEHEVGRAGNPEIGIVVCDLEAVTPFYRDGLGLRHLEDYQVPIGLQRRFAIGECGVLKLMALEDPPTKPHPPGGIFGGHSGVRWITLLVDDIEGVVARCEETGGTLAFPITEFLPGKFMCVVEDPEQNVWVELSLHAKHE